MIIDFLELIALFLLSFYWSPPQPIKIIVWVIVVVALVLLILPWAGVQFHRYP